MNISVLILTHNEEKCIKRALSSVISWSDDIVVLDSYSSDGTEKIVSSFPNVRFIKNKFVDFSTQRNFGLHEIVFKNEWVFMLDADEMCTAELMKEMIGNISKEDNGSISYMMRRKDFFNGQWVKIHFSVWFERLVKPKEVHFVGTVHEKISSNSRQGKIQSCFLHYPFENGIHHWINRHSAYALTMAEIELREKRHIKITELFNINPQKRQCVLKTFYQQLPARWAIYFLYKLIINKGVFCGINGITFVALETIYHYLVAVNLRVLIKGRQCQ
jgi:glycosyltransferase involved in cell wall biosynthesis